MALEDFLYWVHNAPVSRAVREASHLVGAGLQVAHIFGFFLLLSAVFLVSLRLTGLFLPQLPVSRLSRAATPFIWIGFALTVVSGVLMFIATPQRYAANSAFVLKMGLLVVAVLLQTLLFRRIARTDFPGPLPARATAVATVTVWFGIAWAGRFIGFI